MTAYEYLELGQSNLANTIALVSLSIAILSGYCIVAYAVGAKLTRAQVSAFNINYFIWFVFLGLAGGATLASANRRTTKGQEMLGQQVDFPPYSLEMFGLLGILLLTTSLWFMWSVRHPKTE
jgi:hypothetical protein